MSHTRRLAFAAAALAATFAVLTGGPHPAGAPAAPPPRPPAAPTPQPGGRTTPAPHVLPFATTGKAPERLPAGPQPNAVIPEGIDGCDHAYGGVGQCIPWNFPPSVKPADRCAWLAAHGLQNIPVHGRDRHGLDKSHHGKACER
ncbi:hypothetical protein EBN03_16305 [Nocardia stercoris]|uniref:Excalibur calcium-binding domain-containing protein n=2 Tax=Nocardia stercoris TaxID=2483361 RepID=A0A3M2L452_9NOCA|nr:hypothetical protein EBN03_16305 [Nocardia stercoris]